MSRRSSKSHRRSARRPNTGPAGHWVIGRNALREVLKHQPERIRRLVIASNRSELPQDCGDILDEIHRHEIKPEMVSSDSLSQLVGTPSHQSFGALLEPPAGRKLKPFLQELEGREQSLVVVLDAVMDPQNFGAILRAAEFYGADGVIWSSSHGCPVTPVVTKASVGASELLPLIPISSLGDGLLLAKEHHYWIVLADAAPGSVSLSSFEFPARTMLVFGSEGSGARERVKKLADFRVCIPMFGRIQSLNVSQAVSAFLYAYRAAQS